MKQNTNENEIKHTDNLKQPSWMDKNGMHDGKKPELTPQTEA